ncbi:MAG: hypothetical protein SNJ84_00640 [Verrucomicrobiia bacterium]
MAKPAKSGRPHPPLELRSHRDEPLLVVSICSPLGVIYRALACQLEIHARQSVWQVTPDAHLFLTISDLSRIVIHCPDRETTFTLSGIMTIRGNEITLLSEAPLAQ